MEFSIERSIEILERTPAVFERLLGGLSDEWTSVNEGGDSWSAYDVIGHLIHGEETDWIVRAKLILSHGPQKKFEPFDRFAQFENSKGKTLAQLLEEFSEKRKESVRKLRELDITPQDLQKTGEHPAFGIVTLSQLLSTWVVHDLNHIYQVSRVMAKQYSEEVGPWTEFLKILQ
jgi:hypothetical protein